MEAATVLNHDAHAPDYWHDACQYLIAAHPVWRDLIRQYPDRALRTRNRPFETLLRSIVGQRISVLAADAIWGRLALHVQQQFEPSALLECADDDLRACGLSRQQLKYIRDLCAFALAGELELTDLQRMGDDAVMQHVCQVKGIGPWSAQMFLIFALRRPDVWPIGDVGLQKAVGKWFVGGGKLSPEETKDWGVHCAPWRTVATWYLWRSLDPVVVDY